VNIWEQFYWCSSRNQYHDALSSSSNFHYARAPQRRVPPNSGNWPGTAEEMKRYLIWMDIVAEDKKREAEVMNDRIYARLAKADTEWLTNDGG